jgi:hypothetical protein
MVLSVRTYGLASNELVNQRTHRCASFQALYGLVWFVTANILLYGSMDTCRYTSPYIWWLTFGLLCLGYVVVAEMVLVALVVFVLGPLVYVRDFSFLAFHLSSGLFPPRVKQTDTCMHS